MAYQLICSSRLSKFLAFLTELRKRLKHIFVLFRTKSLKVPAHVKKNGTLYLAVFVLPQKSSHVTGGMVLNEDEKSLTRIKLTQFHVPAPETYNLLGSEGKENVSQK